MHYINVRDLMGLILPSCHEFNIDVFALNTTFRFADDEVPDEVLWLTVKSVDNPEFSSNLPLRINVYYGEFEDFSEFKEKYKNFIVAR